ncbi:MAG TPA: hypothetical protein EYG87_03730 [Methanothermococcus okinawensis]|uniref:NAD/GMP synthase domain-containing protein n=1 Tax=Methanofervidicoccus abyssi TaxID=2082189 RepID=A0A401HRM2_9EURY|nr:7-cyano-7-deazaguanine synthase [Methanofervidicoccus abyssi]GBF36865.1 hypothetical protein MHHB_P1095 [Methanofervidicoccus abyssi]HIP16523.1 hypothetical protein [Methanothermococcus okinawensis]HIP35143.1 hypothetical protein [Methanothermococcus okinawensis]
MGNILFSEWTRNYRKLNDLNQLKEDIIKNFQEWEVVDKKIVCMLSGGKDSATALALAKDLGLNVFLAVHFTHKWSWQLSKEEAKKIADRFNIPIKFYDITKDLKKRTKGAKGRNICRICKSIMKSRTIKIAKEEGAEVIMTGDTSVEKISGPIMQYLKEKYGEVRFEKMELTPVPKKYNFLFFRPLIRCGYEDILKIVEYYNIDVKRVYEAGDRWGFWREGCPLQYCDNEALITEELLDKLYIYNERITRVAREDGRFRASIRLPSKELIVVPVKDDVRDKEKEEFIKKLGEILEKL